MGKKFYILIQCIVTVVVSTLISPICTSISEKYNWNCTVVISIVSLGFIIILFIAQKVVMDMDEYGKFGDFVADINNNYKGIEKNFNKLEENHKEFHAYHKDVKLYMTLHTKSKEDLNDMLAEFNKERFEVIRAEVQELEEEFSIKLSEFNSKFEVKAYKADRKSFSKELEKMYDFLTRRLHKIESYIDMQSCNNKRDDDVSSGF